MIPKKYQKIKTGTFTKDITDTEKKLMEENFKFQLDVYNMPTVDSCQKELSKSKKKIVKISGLNEIEKRLGV